jgi:ubiquinone/menaquinone biosynthesis C-methylase UbiE
MADESSNEIATTATDRPNAGEEFYNIADEQVQIAYVQTRRAAQWVPFLLPHLRSGLRLLDCGCGVGSITLDLAERVTPGEAVGVDLDETQLALARAGAAERGLTNAHFQVASAYGLPFADASFDVVLAHTLLIHLREPLRALREFRRVLAPGGLVAIADDDMSTWRIAPADSPLQRLMREIGPQLSQATGGSPLYSPSLRGLLLEAGFARTQGFALAAEHYGSLEETRRFATLITRLLRNPELAQVVLAHGWTTPEQNEADLAAVQEWGERPDAFAAVMYCAALGWVDPAP